MLITSFDPLRIYLYNDGLVRFATDEYSNPNKSSKKRYVHLTNYSVNKHAPKFERNKDPDVYLNNLRPMIVEVNGVFLVIRRN